MKPIYSLKRTQFMGNHRQHLQLLQLYQNIFWRNAAKYLVIACFALKV